jgi:hypothetical protein
LSQARNSAESAAAYAILAELERLSGDTDAADTS